MIVFEFLAELFFSLSAKKVVVATGEAKDKVEKEMVAKVLEKQEKAPPKGRQ